MEMLCKLKYKLWDTLRVEKIRVVLRWVTQVVYLCILEMKLYLMIIRILIALNCESVWCKIKVNKSNNLTIGVCYRSWAASNEELQELFNVIKSASQWNVLIMGDFNYSNTNLTVTRLTKTVIRLVLNLGTQYLTD